MLKYIPANAQHIGARREQQDSFAFSDPADKSFVVHGGLLGIIADGMGGLEGGRQASSAAVAAFLAAYSRKTPAEQIPAALRRSLFAANEAVKSVAQQMGTEEGTGTTLVAGVVHNTSLYWISAGDSRMYVLRQGHLARVNADHTYGTDLWPEVAAGRMDRQQALTDPQAPHLTSYLGLPEVPSCDVSLRAFPLEPDDIFLACTDGVYRAISEDEMAEAFRSAPPGPACEAIKAATVAKNNPQQDNLTLIAIQLRDTSTPVHLPAAAPAAAAAAPPKRRSTAMIAVLGLEALFAVGLTTWYVAQPPVSAHKGASGTQAPGNTKPQPGKSSPAGRSAGTNAPAPPSAPGQVQPGPQGQTPAPPSQNLPGGSTGPQVIPLHQKASHPQLSDSPKNPDSAAPPQDHPTPPPHGGTAPSAQGPPANPPQTPEGSQPPPSSSQTPPATPGSTPGANGQLPNPNAAPNANTDSKTGHKSKKKKTPSTTNDPGKEQTQ